MRRSIEAHTPGKFLSVARFIAYVGYCGVVCHLGGKVFAEYNPGNVCALCPADTCVNLNSEVDCNGVVCELKPAAQFQPDEVDETTCRTLFRATSDQSVVIRNCIQQDQDEAGGNFITCSETVMWNLGKREVECLDSRYCRCVATEEGAVCAASTAGKYIDMDDCNGGLYPMPVPPGIPEV